MALLSNINNLFSVDSTGAIEFSTQVGATGSVLESRGAGNPPVWTDRDTGRITGSGAANRVTYWTGTYSIGSDAGFTYNGAGRVNTDESFGVSKDGADTVADGPFFRLTNAAATRQYLWQLDASNNIDYWYYNGSAWTQTISLLTDGGATFAGNVGIGVAAHGTASLNITNANQHIRLNNGSELGIISLDTDGKLDLWAHGTDETINFRTGTGSGTVTMSVVGEEVGIGTELPDANLHIDKDDASPVLLVKASGQTSSTAPFAKLVLAAGSATGADVGSNIMGYRTADFSSAAARSTGLKFGVLQNNTAKDAMWINEAQNVGIGTNSPEGRLMVETAGADATPPIKINRGRDGGRIQMQYAGNESGYGEIGQMYAGTGRTQIWIGANLNSFATGHSSAPVQDDANYASWFSTWDSYNDRFTVNRISSGSTSQIFTINSDGNTIFTGRIGAETTLTPLWSVQTGTSAVTIPNARYLNFYTGEINYANFSRGFMCSISDDTAVNQPKQIGLIMHNNSKVNNTFSPGIVFGSQANSGSYSDATAMIAARRNGQSGDANWSSGQLWFWTATAGATISTSSPDRGLPDGFPAMVINEYRRVMIGTNIAATTGQPVISQALQVATGNSNDGIIIHGNGSDDGMTSGEFRKIGFRYDETDQSFESEIRFVVTDSTNHGGQLEFWTDSTNGTTTRAMTINKLQYVGIGANSPAEKLHVSGGNIRLDSTVAGGNGILMIYDSSGTQSGQIYGSSSDLKIYSPVDVLFNQGGNVGIGNTSPGTKLHVSSTGTSTRFESSGSYSDIQFVSTAGMNFVNFGSANEFLLYQGGGSGANITTKIDTSGNATFKGDVVAYGSPSDIRLKENIKPIKSALDKVSKLNGVTFDWKEKTEHLDKKGNPINLQQWKHDVGFIAQDVQKVVPELVRENDNGMLSMRHQGIAPILLEAIKELKAEIEELKSNKCNCNK